MSDPSVMYTSEDTSLLPRKAAKLEKWSLFKKKRKIVAAAALCSIASILLIFLLVGLPSSPPPSDIPLLRKSNKGEQSPTATIPKVQKRCDWLLNVFHTRDATLSKEELKERYTIQSTDPNVFYRATACVFWHDFVQNKWGAPLQSILLNGSSPLSLYTWVTGDQHLSNFGAWRNRHDDVVFGVNDFDESAIYDFQVDVLRIAVSICSHARTNGLSKRKTKKALKAFAKKYIRTVLSYVDNDKALLFELTPKTAYGTLDDYLIDVEHDESIPKQLQKFTYVNKTTNTRHFKKGPVDIPHNKTNLATLPPEREEAIRAQFTSTKYGATMMKLGWQVHSSWDPDFFHVLDVAERVGSGVGSYGVDRYYVLLKGKDTLLGESREHGSVILDVKYQPPGAVTSILTLEPTPSTYGSSHTDVCPSSGCRGLGSTKLLRNLLTPTPLE